jgi:hypothetical protein
MDWQQALSLLLVCMTAALFIRGAMKKKRRTSQACGDCEHCAPGPSHLKR